MMAESTVLSHQDLAFDDPLSALLGHAPGQQASFSPYDAGLPDIHAHGDLFHGKSEARLISLCFAAFCCMLL